MGIQTMLPTRYRILLHVIAIAAIVLCGPTSGLGQASPTATGPGMYIAVGGMFSLFEGDYGQRKIRGSAVYVDANLFRYYGLETEIRRLLYSDSPGMNQTTFLAGPRVSFRSHGVVPYAKMLVGIGIFNFPYHDGQGSYLALAPGAGLDWNMGRKIRVRLIDVEYQDWSQFTFGPEHPYGASIGISYQIVSSSGLGHSRYRRD
jgi:hypothetical protein